MTSVAFFFLNPLHLYFNKSFAKEIGRRNVCNEPQNCDFQVVPQKFVYNPLRENSTRYTVESLLTAGQCLDGARNRIKTYTMLQPLPPLPTTTRTTRHHGYRHYCHRHCHPYCCRHCHHRHCRYYVQLTILCTIRSWSLRSLFAPSNLLFICQRTQTMSRGAANAV